MKDTGKAEYLYVDHINSSGEEKRQIKLTCPHFVMRGAVGGDKQIGQVVFPSSCPMMFPFDATDASAEERGMIICKISCH